MSKTAAHNTTPQYEGGKRNISTVDSSRQRSAFVAMAANMTWQLAIAVLVPVIGGVQLDRAADTSPTFLIVGIVVAAIASTVVMWLTMQRANRLPVPKLTDAQRKAIKKSYEEDDD